MRISDWSSDVCSSDLLQGFLANCGRRGQHDRRLRTDVGISANASARFQPRLFTKLLGTNEHQPRPVNDARAVAAVMNVTQLLAFGVAILGDRLKTALAETFKRGLELRAAFQRRSGTPMFTMVKKHFAYPILDPHNSPLYTPYFP